MSAEILRRAASLMRERGEAALREDDWRRGIAKLGRRTPKGQHMDGWHPAVALAVADWLSDEADRVEDNVALYQPAATQYDSEAAWIERNHRAALAVARTYLGEQP